VPIQLVYSASVCGSAFPAPPYDQEDCGERVERGGFDTVHRGAVGHEEGEIGREGPPMYVP
jgi:hypothetical protein